MSAELNAVLTQLSRDLTDQGRLIEAGFVGLRIAAFDPETPTEQIAEMRKVFMAGAQHLFSSIMTIMDSDAEPTEADLARLEKISDELDRFGDELALEYGAPKGRA